MNHKRNIRAAIVLALVALLMNTLTVWAYPAEAPDATQNKQSTGKVYCYEILKTADEVTAGIDIPAHRADYAALDRIADCIQIAGINISLIPTTGRATWATSRFLEMKDRQAELLDRSGYPVQRQMDPRFMEFKERQAAERMGP